MELFEHSAVLKKVGTNIFNLPESFLNIKSMFSPETKAEEIHHYMLSYRYVSQYTMCPYSWVSPIKCCRKLHPVHISCSQELLHINCVLAKTRATRTPAFRDTPTPPPPPPHPMITHTSDSHEIPSHNKTKSKLQLLKKLPKIQISKFCRNFTCDTSEVAL